MYYGDYTQKIATYLKNTGVKVNSFSKSDEVVDGEISLGVPDRQVHIQICPYHTEQGLLVNEVLGTGKNLRIKTLRTFKLSQNGLATMMAFIKELQN